MKAQQFVSRHLELINAIQYDGTNMREILDWCKTMTNELTFLEVWVPQMSVGQHVVQLRTNSAMWEQNPLEIMSDSDFLANYRPSETSETT